MHPDDPQPTPELLRKRPVGESTTGPEPEVGEFRQGSPFSQWALARYLVGRAIAESVGASLLVVAIALLVLAVLSQWLLHTTLLTVLLAIVLVGVLLVRWIGLALVRRVTGFASYGPLEQRMQSLVADTRRDVRRELRRIGLPSHIVTLPLLAVRLVSRRRRPQTVERLRTFDTGRAVPKARQDEMHLLLRQALGRTSGPVSS